MTEAPPKTVPPATLTRLLEWLTESGPNRDLDAELFRLIDSRPVRVASVSAPYILENRPHDALELFGETPIYDDWVSEMREFETDDVENGQMVFHMSKCGYIDKAGAFVERPHLEAVPRFTLNLPEAMSFKHSVFVHGFRLRLTEAPTDFDCDYVAELLDESNVIRSSYRSDTPAKAVIGVVLSALTTGLPGWGLQVA